MQLARRRCPTSSRTLSRCTEPESSLRAVDAQIVPFIERVLYAEDEEGALQAMEDCRQRFTQASAEAALDDPISDLVGQMSPLRV